MATSSNFSPGFSFTTHWLASLSPSSLEALSRLAAIEDGATLRASAALLGLLEGGASAWFQGAGDSRIDIERNVKQLAALRNPANRRQLLDVLEVWGSVYKAQYRMRFIYARLPGDCVLMGQEILESSSL